jgi:hypothetical protein
VISYWCVEKITIFWVIPDVIKIFWNLTPDSSASSANLKPRLREFIKGQIPYGPDSITVTRSILSKPHMVGKPHMVVGGGCVRRKGGGVPCKGRCGRDVRRPRQVFLNTGSRGIFDRCFSTPMHYPALTSAPTCGANRAS